MKCAECDWKYPSSLLNPMFIQDGYTPHICGICALKLSNKYLGIERESFHGEMAEATRQAAIIWRKNHPNNEPVK